MILKLITWLNIKRPAGVNLALVIIAALVTIVICLAVWQWLHAPAVDTPGQYSGDAAWILLKFSCIF